MKTTYKGITTELSNNLFDEPKINIQKPKKIKKFGYECMYYKGNYYIVNTLKEVSENELTAEGQKIKDTTPYKIGCLFYVKHKWYSDTSYITEDYKNTIIK